jgi:hypothetical protein
MHHWESRPQVRNREAFEASLATVIQYWILSNRILQLSWIVKLLSCFSERGSPYNWSSNTRIWRVFLSQKRRRSQVYYCICNILR